MNSALGQRAGSAAPCSNLRQSTSSSARLQRAGRLKRPRAFSSNGASSEGSLLQQGSAAAPLLVAAAPLAAAKRGPQRCQAAARGAVLSMTVGGSPDDELPRIRQDWPSNGPLSQVCVFVRRCACSAVAFVLQRMSHRASIDWGT